MTVFENLNLDLDYKIIGWNSKNRIFKVMDNKERYYEFYVQSLSVENDNEGWLDYTYEEIAEDAAKMAHDIKRFDVEDDSINVNGKLWYHVAGIQLIGLEDEIDFDFMKELRAI